MPPRNSYKNKDVLKEMEKTISPVLVVNNSSLKPYVELFEYSPENIYQQPLGSLVGFFEVKEYSQDSAYIVNFLTSVLKKEYYINPKRSVEDSLDSALHKVNMALSELAKHGNVEWLGKLHAAICVLEKNSTHFSVAGNAKIFLYRNKTLSEISEDLASDATEPHPLKTFVNVSSGRLEKNDRLLVTTEDIFHILPASELKKNFQRFEGDKFVQFLKTALSNQMEMIASIVVDMKEPEAEIEPKAVPRKKTNRTANAFSKETFAQAPTSIASVEETLQAMHEEESEIAEYTDQKTGHIYIQGEPGEQHESSTAQLYWDQTKEKVAESWYLAKNDLRRRYSLYKKQLAKQRQLRQAEKEKRQQLEAEQAEILRQQQELEEIEQEKQFAIEVERQKFLVEAKQQERQRQAAIELAEQELQKKTLIVKEESVEIITPAEKLEEKPVAPVIEEVNPPAGGEEVEEDIEEFYVPQTPAEKARALSFKEKLALAMNEQQRGPVIDLRANTKNTAVEKEIEISEEEFEDESWEETTHIRKPSQMEQARKLSARTLTSLKEISQKISDKTKQQNFNTEKFKAIAPHFSKIGKLFNSFSSKQKKLTIGALIFIFVAPVFINRWTSKPLAPPAPLATTQAPSQAEILSHDKNINIGASSQTLLSRTDLISTLVTNAGTAAITKKSIVMIDTSGSQKEFPLPGSPGNAVKAAFMKDLSLIFVLTDQNKIISFSSNALKFADNNIDLPSNPTGLFIGTYLTYLYVIDPASNQIYRYPRADGGFGDKTSWLKDSLSLANISDMTIDDNIYAIQNNQVLKFFKGKKVDFSLEASSTPVHFDRIYSTPDLQSFYVLDIKNSRIVTYSKDGQIVSQAYNELLSQGTSIAVNEQNKVAYVTTPSGLISIQLQ